MELESPSVTFGSLIDRVGKSSSMIVATPMPLLIVVVPTVFSKFESVMVKVSFPSTSESPMMGTAIVWLDGPPAVNVRTLRKRPDSPQRLSLCHQWQQIQS